MRLPRLAALVVGVGLLASASAPAQDGKKDDGGPKQYVMHDGFVWKAWASKGDRGILTVSGVLKKKGGPGEFAYLQPAEPQGINPKILILEVKLGHLPGAWPEPLVDIPVVSTLPGAGPKGGYESVTVRFQGGQEIQLKVNEGPAATYPKK